MQSLHKARGHAELVLHWLVGLLIALHTCMRIELVEYHLFFTSLLLCCWNKIVVDYRAQRRSALTSLSLAGGWSLLCVGIACANQLPLLVYTETRGVAVLAATELVFGVEHVDRLVLLALVLLVRKQLVFGKHQLRMRLVGTAWLWLRDRELHASRLGQLRKLCKS
jgi:hypothetical protein